VYILVFKVRFQLFDSSAYVVLIFCGLVPFLGFSEAMSSGVGSVSSNASLIKNTMFPVEMVPVQTLCTTQVSQVIGTSLLLVAVAAVRGLTWWAMLLPLVWILQLMFLAGLLWIISALNVFLRDLQTAIGIVVMLLMMLSPIAYTREMVPAAMQAFILLNPVAHFVFCYQSILMVGASPPIASAIFVAIASPLLFVVGYKFFVRMKRVMVDHV
jgi:lipopolysaccharide transport system permease protein